MHAPVAVRAAGLLMTGSELFRGELPEHARSSLTAPASANSFPPNSLMFAITNIFNCLVPAGSTVFTLIALSRGRTCTQPGLSCNR